MLRIVAEFADDWNYPGGPPDDFARKVEILHGHCAAVGRDPASIMLSCHLFVSDDANETADRAAGYVEAGAEHVCLYFMDNTVAGRLGGTAKRSRGRRGIGSGCDTCVQFSGRLLDRDAGLIFEEPLDPSA